MSLKYVVKCCPDLCHTQWHHWLIFVFKQHFRLYLIARFMGPKWGPSGADKTQVGPMFTPWTLLSGIMKFVYWFVGWPKESFCNLVTYCSIDAMEEMAKTEHICQHPFSLIWQHGAMGCYFIAFVGLLLLWSIGLSPWMPILNGCGKSFSHNVYIREHMTVCKICCEMWFNHSEY